MAADRISGHAAVTASVIRRTPASLPEFYDQDAPPAAFQLCDTVRLVAQKDQQVAVQESVLGHLRCAALVDARRLHLTTVEIASVTQHNIGGE